MPIDGWHYEQTMKDGGVQRIPPKGCAGDDVQLVKQVKQFRAGAHIDLGEPEVDIAAYIKQHSPINDRYPGRLRRPETAPRIRSIKPLIERVRDWLLFLQPKQPRLLIEDDAKRRGRICANCPQNIEWKTGCLPCCDEIVQRGRHVRQRIDYPYADALRGCRAHGFYLPTAVFIDRDALGDTGAQAPEECWMHTEPRTT